MSNSKKTENPAKKIGIVGSAIIIGDDSDTITLLADQLREDDVEFTQFDWSSLTSDFDRLIAAAENAPHAIIIFNSTNEDLVQLKLVATALYLSGVGNIAVALANTHKLENAQKTFQKISKALHEFLRQFGADKTRSDFDGFAIVPICKPDKATHDEKALAWYRGKSVYDHLISTDTLSRHEDDPLRFSISTVEHVREDLVRLSGRINAGRLSKADEIILLPAAKRMKLSGLFSADKEIEKAGLGDHVSLLVKDDIEATIGDMVCAAASPAQVADHFETTLFWTSKDPLLASRAYRFELANSRTRATITDIKYVIDKNTHTHLAAKQMHCNEIGVCNVSLDDELAFEPFSNNPTLGTFKLIDRDTNERVGLGIIHFALRRATNVHRHKLDINSDQRARMKHQSPMILWFTGLSGAGKSAIANLLETRLVEMNKHTYTLDGDNIRHGLNKDLGFTDTDRVENIRRIGEVSSLMADAGLIVMVSFISPFRAERELARRLAGDKTFIEIHIDTPLEVAEARDVKGLYKKARAGEIANFTGIDSPYEPPQSPEIAINTVELTAAEAADEIINKLLAWGFLRRNN